MKGSNSDRPLQDQFRRLRIVQMLCVVCVLAALIAYFFNKWLSVLPLCLAFALRLYFKKLKKEYCRAFLHQRAELTLQRHLEQGRHSFDTPLSEETLRKVRMLPCDGSKSGATCCEGGSGQYHGRDVLLSSAAFAHTYTPERAKRVNYTVGTWVCVQLKKDTGMDCRFLSPRTVPPKSLEEMLWVETDLHITDTPAGLTNHWQVVCREGEEILPGSGFLKQLNRLYEKTDGLAAVCVQKDWLHFLLEDELLAQEVSIRTAPEKCPVTDLLPGLSHGLRLADFLPD